MLKSVITSPYIFLAFIVFLFFSQGCAPSADSTSTKNNDEIHVTQPQVTDPGDNPPTEDPVIDDPVVEEPIPGGPGIDDPVVPPPSDPVIDDPVSDLVFNGVEEFGNVMTETVDISWDLVEDAVGYAVFVSDPETGILWVRELLDHQTDTYTVTSLLPGRTYYIRVNAMDSFGLFDANENIITVTTEKIPEGYYNMASLLFEGEQFISLGDSSQLLKTSNFSLGFWFKTDHLANEKEVMLAMHAKESPQTALEVGLNGNKIYLSFQNHKGRYHLLTAKRDYDDNEWHFVTIARDAKRFYFYVDGKFIAKDREKFSGFGTYPAIIGSWDGENSPFLGQIDEMSFWTDDLYANDVRNLYNDGVSTDLFDSVFKDTLAHWYRFGDDITDTLEVMTDLVGVNQGTLYFFENRHLIFSDGF